MIEPSSGSEPRAVATWALAREVKEPRSLLLSVLTSIAEQRTGFEKWNIYSQ